ncbi:MAG TPA: hypothetical protein VHN14_03495 [Kofleriaceae bacterium]|jgi:hypothetical protein|nr:hypothetical protein [Kofleriaceae bacterium]
MHQRTHKVKYVSDYLIPEVRLPQGPDFHRITLAWDRSHPEAGGSLLLDPNSCGLDEFGEATVCTEIAGVNSDVKLTRFKQKPGHQAYTLESRPHGSTFNYAALPLRLVTIAARGKDPARVHLLVLTSDQTIDRIIELHEKHRA